MNELWRDLRHGTRALRRTPGFTTVTVLSLALGIGATTTLFSVTYGVLLKPLPWPDSARLVRITETREGREPRVRGTMSNGPYFTWTAEHTTIDALGGWLNQPPSTLAIGAGDPSQIQTIAVTPSLFRVLEARPLAGRLFVDDDQPTGAARNTRRAIILSYGLWRERFGGGDVVGRVVRVDGQPLTIVGIMPKEFVFPDRNADACTPWLPPPVFGDGVQSMTIFSALARLRPGVTPAQAAVEGTARARSAPDPGMTAVALFGGRGPAELRATPAIELMTADVRPALLVLLAAVALLLVTATANSAMLQLTRAIAGRRDLAIRAAIGAGAAQLARQIVVESTILGAVGGLGGVAIAVILHRVLPAVLPADFPRTDAIAVDWRVLVFAIAASAIAGVACALLPAWHARRADLVSLLSEDGNAPIGGGVRTGAARARTLLVAGQLAVSCVLLVGALLLVRSFVALLHVDRGYDPTNVLTARIALPSDFSMERRTALLERIAERLRVLPGVRDAAYGNALPLLISGGFRGMKLRPPADPSAEVDINIIQRSVSPGYFRALGLRVTAGRALSAADTAAAPEAIVVNRSFAAKYLGPRPLGTIVSNLGMCRPNHDRWEVVGVVDDMQQGATADGARDEVFMPLAQVGCANALSQAVIVLRTAGDPLAYTTALRRAVRDEQPSIAVDSLMTMEDRVLRALAKPRLYAVVLGGFAVAALAIAALGLFGVLSYIVAQRSREIGVRTALGAQASDIVRLVLQQVAVVVAGGLVVGFAAAFALGRALTTILYGVDAHDPASFVAAAIVLPIVAAVACVVPARRAARVDPLQAMR